MSTITRPAIKLLTSYIKPDTNQLLILVSCRSYIFHDGPHSKGSEREKQKTKGVFDTLIPLLSQQQNPELFQVEGASVYERILVNVTCIKLCFSI